MIGFLKQNKVALGGGIALAALVLVYFMFFSGGSSTPALTASDANSPLSSDLLVNLQNLNSIKLNESIFKDPVFVTLQPFGVTLAPENVGRRNPFLPLSPLASGAPVSTSTLKLPLGR